MKNLKSLNKHLLGYRYRLFLGIIFIALSNVFGVYSPQVIRDAVDSVTTQINYNQFFSGSFLAKEYMEIFGISILFFGIVVVVLAIIRGIFVFFMRQTIIVMSRLIEYDQKNEIFSHYQQLHLDFYKRNNTGDLMSRITEDVSRVRMYTGPAIMYTINLVVLFAMVIYTMIRVNPLLTLYTVAPLPILGLTIFFVNGIIERKSELIQRQLAFLTTISQESFSGIRVIKSFAREEQQEKDFRRSNQSQFSNSMRILRSMEAVSPLVETIAAMGVALALLYVYVENLPAAKFIALIGGIFLLYEPIKTLSRMHITMQRSIASTIGTVRL